MPVFPIEPTRTRCAVAALLSFAAAATSHAQHSDIVVTRENLRLATSAETARGVAPARVFAADFGEAGIPRYATEPGFDAAPETLAPFSRLGFNATAPLRHFDGTTANPVGDERLELSFLILSTTVGPKPVAGFDLAVPADGGFHQHLAFELFSAGAPLAATGVYILELELYSTDGETAPSEPFWIVFNDGASEEEHDAAIAWVEENLAGAGTPCAADLDGSGEVGATDLASLLVAWSSPSADLNGDGTTDAADLAALLLAWGPC